MQMILENLIPLGLALMSLGIGVGALIAPKLSSIMYGAPTNDYGFVKAAGVRDFYIAIMIFVLWRDGAGYLLYISVFALAIVSAGDAAITFLNGDRSRSPLHLVAAVGVAGYSVFMLVR